MQAETQPDHHQAEIVEKGLDVTHRCLKRVFFSSYFEDWNLAGTAAMYQPCPVFGIYIFVLLFLCN